jgi:uncharacterized protein
VTPDGAARTTDAAGPGIELEEKRQRLVALLESYGSVIVAFSGGVDSAFVAWTATQVLGRRALCITADSPSYSDHHRQLALTIAATHGLRHEIVRTDELGRQEYRANPVNRCYYCKHELYTVLSRLARERGFAAVADGSNADDRGDYRPGRQAAREFGVRSPLDACELTKDDIRALSRLAGLSTWNEPASACLSSRIPYHSNVTDEKLRMIEQAEAAIRALGLRICRVRHHDMPSDASTVLRARAQIELGRDEMGRIADALLHRRVLDAAREAGYTDAAIDPRGYRTGSLNEGLRLTPIPASR